MATTFEDARKLILDALVPLGPERVSLFQAAGRILAEEVVAPRDMPGWDNSAMDGFALRCADLSQGGALPISGYIPAGGAPLPELPPGCAVRIMTGAPIPPGADTVVPFEQALEEDGKVSVTGRISPGDHVRLRGEDFRAGEAVLPPGSPLRPPEINLLATLGRLLVTVHRRPRVAILSTGDELAEPGDPLTPGMIVNSNSLSLASAAAGIGAEPILLGIARDNPESLREKLLEGLKADALITSAGVSAGDRDLVREILRELGVREVFWKVAIRPGQPTAFGLHEGRPVFSLPGNPVATLITFEAFVRPALLRMMGHARPVKPCIQAPLRESVKKKAGRVQFLRVCLVEEEGRLTAASSGDQKTGILRTMVSADGFAVLPAERERFEAGEMVDVHLLDR